MAVTRSFETARLRAQCPSEEDAAAVNQAIAESHGELKRWLDWAQALPSLQESQRRARETQAAFSAGERFGFNTFLKEAGDLVCKLELRPAPKWIQELIAPGDWWEFGYWCRTKYTGQGYMSEAMGGAMRWAMSELGLAWFIIRMDAENFRSQTLAARIGFKMTQTHPTTFLGEPRVEWIYEARAAMIQTILTILIVAAAGVWMGWYAYRFLRPRNKAGCGGGCGCGHEETARSAPAASGGKTMFLPSEDLVRRIQAKKH